MLASFPPIDGSNVQWLGHLLAHGCLVVYGRCGAHSSKHYLLVTRDGMIGSAAQFNPATGMIRLLISYDLSSNDGAIPCNVLTFQFFTACALRGRLRASRPDSDSSFRTSNRNHQMVRTKGPWSKHLSPPPHNGAVHPSADTVADRTVFAAPPTSGRHVPRTGGSLARGLFSSIFNLKHLA